MKAIELKMPDEVYQKLEKMASHDHQQVDAFALRKLEELVRAVETFAECADLYRRARWLAVGPLVEAAACALLRPGGGRAEYDPDPVGVDRARRRTGQTFACEPLIALAVAGGDPAAVAGRWRGRPAGLRRL